MAPITIVHCWSAPRSRSTALLYSFEARSPAGGGRDTVALDEPLYRRWLREKTGGAGAGDGGGAPGVSRPYAEHLLGGDAPPDVADPEEARRWTREGRCHNQRVHDAVKALLEGGGDDGGGCVFLKQMAKFSHLFDFETNWEMEAGRCQQRAVEDEDPGRWREECLRLAAERGVELRHRHVLLIRDPVSVLASWMGKSGDVHGNNPHPDEVGIAQLLDVYSRITGASTNRGRGGEGESPIAVVDSDDLAANPPDALGELCAALGIDYRDSMLSWESGPHECDGPWAKWWYHDVWESSGWDVSDDDAAGVDHPRTQRYRTVPAALLPALRMSIPAYGFLRTLTSAHGRRAIDRPPSGRLYEDPRNESVLVYVGTPSAVGPDGRRRRGTARIVPRDMAAISPFDSSVQGGDATWEGIRIYNGRIFHLDRHLDRLFRSAKALGFTNVHTRSEVTEAIFRILAANGMRDGAHMRLTLTRGEKCTSSMNPLFNVYGTTLIILPEWKPTEGATTYNNTDGITLVTAGTCRRSPPSTLDNKIHHNNMIQNILPKIQANLAGAADSIMLDLDGFVAETNATNLFMVRRDHHGRSNCIDGREGVDGAVLVTPTADHCLPGITRDTVLLLAKEIGLATEVRRVSLSEFYAADEVFTTGTMGELTPVTKIDGRAIGWDDSAGRGPITELLQNVYKKAVETRLEWSTEIPAFS